MFELIYTSAPQGLIAGRSGFCTVAMTGGFPPNLIAAIENMSGYKTLFPPGNPASDRNPVNYSCQHLFAGNTRYTVVSRIAFANLSYTGRTNVLAHHLIFTDDEFSAIPGGAAAILSAPENFPPWEGAPRILPQRGLQTLHVKNLPSNSAQTWEKLFGVSHYAPWAAKRFRRNPDRATVIAFDPLKYSGEDMLQLAAEMSALLTPEELREFTFCTYCYTASIGNPLALRAYPQDSPLLNSIRRLEPESVIEAGRMNPLPADALEEEPEIELPAAPRNTAPPQPRKTATPPPAARNTAKVPEKTVGRQTREKSPQNINRLLFIMIFVLAVLLILVLLWRLAAPRKTVVTAPGGDNIVIIDEGRTVSSPVKQVPEQQSLPRFSAEPEQQSKPQEKQLPAAPVFGNVQPEELVFLHVSFRTKERFELPQCLNGTTMLDVSLNGIGKLKPPQLEKFVSGNRSRRLTIYPAKEIKSDFGTEITPDTSSGEDMTLQLHYNTIITKIPPADRLYPNLKNFNSIRFHGPGNSVYSFEPENIPDALCNYFTRDPGKTEIQQDRNIITVTLSLSPELWTLREYFDLQIEGRPQGGAGITEKTLQLKQWDFSAANTLTRRRNDRLKDLLLIEKRIARYCQSRDMKKPEIPSEVKSTFGDKLKKLENAVEQDDPDLSAYVKQLDPEEKDWGLQRFHEAWHRWQKNQKGLKELDKEKWKVLHEYNKRNDELTKVLQSTYPILFKVFQGHLEEKKVILIDNLRDMSPRTLREMIEFKVIRRQNDGSR